MFRHTSDQPEVLLVHPGGPFWRKKDEGAWSIPKGLYEPGEDPLAAARREFEEETGHSPSGEFLELGSFRQLGGKVVRAWAVESDFDVGEFKSNLFSLEWPPRSGRMQQFPEADRVAWFHPEEALRKILKGQTPILLKLFEQVSKPDAI
jgi:predicted NUDIX family NTP pyrophosphohydrolase